MTEHIPISIAYKTKRGAIKVETFKDLRCPDPLITYRSSKVPRDCEILEIGVGSLFRNKYIKKYKK